MDSINLMWHVIPVMVFLIITLRLWVERKEALWFAKHLRITIDELKTRPKTCDTCENKSKL